MCSRTAYTYQRSSSRGRGCRRQQKRALVPSRLPRPSSQALATIRDAAAQRHLPGDQVAGCQQQIDQVGGVVPDAGSIQPAIFFPHREEIQIRKNNVGMGRKDHQVLAFRRPQAADDIFGSVAGHIPAHPAFCSQSRQKAARRSSLTAGRRQPAQRAQQFGLFVPAARGIVQSTCFDRFVHGICSFLHRAQNAEHPRTVLPPTDALFMIQLSAWSGKVLAVCADALLVPVEGIFPAAGQCAVAGVVQIHIESRRSACSFPSNHRTPGR